MKELLAKASARHLRHLALDKGTLALTIGMGGLVLLLLAGTQVVDWYWPVLLAAASLGAGLYGLRKQIPSRYQLAQRIDRRMALADSLSTAVYFGEHPVTGSEGICAMQRRAAEGLAETVNLEEALPFARPRYLAAAVALLAAASGLFVARYVVLGSLDLNGSLMAVAMDSFFTSPVDEDQAKAKLKAAARVFDPSQPAQPGDEGAPVILPPDAMEGQPLLASNDPREGAGQSQDKNNVDKGQSGDEGKGDDNGVSDKKPGESERQDESGQQQNEEPSGVFDKLRDAVNNLLNKMDQREGSPKDAKADGKKKQQPEKGKDAGQNSEPDENAEGSPQDSSQQGDAGKPQDSKQANGGEKPSDKAASGFGDQDGDKTPEEIKQLEAMGKLSELLAQRADEIRGEVMMEVTTTKQQLRTAKTAQKGGGAVEGGEIHRDQIPLADQLFVERYFEQVRKAGK